MVGIVLTALYGEHASVDGGRFERPVRDVGDHDDRYDDSRGIAYDLGVCGSEPGTPRAVSILRLNERVRTRVCGRMDDL